MQFLLETLTNGRNKLLQMEHKGEILEWVIEGYRKFTPDRFVFGDINRTLRNLSEADQDALWQVYKELSKDFFLISDLSKLDRTIMAAIAAIERLVPYKLVVDQVNGDGTLWIPPDPKSNEKQRTVNFSAFTVIEDSLERLMDENGEEMISRLTYTKNDHIQLGILTVYLKLFMPILSHYSNIVRTEIDDLFLRVKTMELMSGSLTEKQDGWVRLNNYVTDFWVRRKKNDKISIGTVLKGLSEENAPNYLFSELVFRKLLPIGVSHTNQDVDDSERPNFIKGLFHTVSSFVAQLTKDDQNDYFMEKEFPNTEVGEEDQTAKLENYRIAAEFHETAVVTANVFAGEIENILRHVDPTLPRELLEIAYHQDTHRSINPVRTALMQYTLAKALSPRMIDYIDDHAYRNCFRVAYALLTHWGYHDLARILDSKIHYDIDAQLVFNQLEITVGQVKEIQQYYPHEIESNRAKSESKRNSNYVIIACQQLQDAIKGRTCYAYQDDETWQCDLNVQYDLASLIIMMNQRGFI